MEGKLRLSSRQRDLIKQRIVSQFQSSIMMVFTDLQKIFLKALHNDARLIFH